MSPELAAAIDGLRAYLDRVGFRAIYKFVVGVNRYATAPSLITRRTAADLHVFFDQVLGGAKDLALLQCLMTGRPARRTLLPKGDQRLADALVAVGLLATDEGGRDIVAADRQLISAFGIDLLIDRRIHFGGEIHDIYIGPDSYWLLYYVDVAGIRRDHRIVDLCTGSSIGASYLSLFSDNVVATDIGEVPLALAEINRRLNRRDEAVEIRRQNLRDTLDGRERFDLLTCNPPFVAIPPGYGGTLYASGTGPDGLGYMRDIVERLPDALNPGGSAYLVADMCGGADGPHFLAELERYAADGRMEIDAYVDYVLPAAEQVEAMTSFLRRTNRVPEDRDVTADFEAFRRDTLAADYYFLTTLKLRTASRKPGLRLMRRWLTDAPTAKTAWPRLLLTA